MEMIPVVDLRLLTQAELNTLSLSSSSSPSSAFDPRRFDDVVVPKIDRAVFNESAGSRKQTYSRLRLAPRKPDLSSTSGSRSSRRRSGGLLSVPSTPTHAVTTPSVVDDPGRRENKKIVLFLRRLFAKNGIETVNSNPSIDGSTADPSPNPNPNSALRKRGRKRQQQAAAGVPDAEDRDRELLNINGVAVNLVALGEKEDLFGEELRKRTEGLVAEEEFLGFLSGLEGQWGSRRKRRKMVDAGKFGDGLPKGWKILLGLKRKEGNISIHCRRYISPTGKQFTSCKEVSSYLLSFVGPQESRQQILGQEDENTPRADKLATNHAVGLTHQEDIMRGSPNCSLATPISPIPADSQKQIVLSRIENPAKAQLQNLLKCQKCNITFADNDAHVKHILTFDHRSAKRCRLGKSVGDGVIIKDGKYECQFCHEMFTERHRYTGHVGIHVKYYDKDLATLPDEIVIQKSINSSSAGVPLALSEITTSIDYEKGKNLVQEIYTSKPIGVINDGSPQGNEHIKNRIIDCNFKFCEYEKEKISVQEICTTKLIGDINDGFPQSNKTIEIRTFDCNAKCCDCDKEKNTKPIDEINDGTPQGNEHIENIKGDCTMKCCDYQKEKNSVQEIFTAKHIGEINDDSHQSNAHIEVRKFDYNPRFHPSGITNETSESKSVDGKLIQVTETGNAMNPELNVCLDATFLSPIDVGNSTSENSYEKGFSASIVIDEIEKSSIEQKIIYECHLCTLSGSGQTSTDTVFSSSSMIDEIEKSNGEHYILIESNLSTVSGSEQIDTNCILASPMRKQELAEMVKSGNDPKSDIECGQVLYDRDVMAENTMRDEIDIFGNEHKRALENCMVISSGSQIRVEPSMDDMLPCNVGEAVLEKMDISGNELEGDFRSVHDVLDIDALRDATGTAAGGNIMKNQVFNIQSSWEQSSSCLPVLDMTTDQGEGELSGVNQKHERIFEDLRLDDDIEPQNFVALTGQDSRPGTAAHMDSAYEAVPDNTDGLAPPVRLEWDAALPDAGGRPQLTTVCVWCSMEFDLEGGGGNPEMQSDSVGFMCPECKAKTSGRANQCVG